jgi:hypothetical protein
MIRTRGINEPGWLLAVDCLSKSPVKKGILDVQLMNRTRTRQSQCEHHKNSSGLYDGAESFLIVDAGTLSETTENPSGLVAIKRAVG